MAASRFKLVYKIRPNRRNKTEMGGGAHSPDLTFPPASGLSPPGEGTQGRPKKLGFELRFEKSESHVVMNNEARAQTCHSHRRPG